MDDRKAKLEAAWKASQQYLEDEEVIRTEDVSEPEKPDPNKPIPPAPAPAKSITYKKKRTKTYGEVAYYREIREIEQLQAELLGITLGKSSGLSVRINNGGVDPQVIARKVRDGVPMEEWSDAELEYVGGFKKEDVLALNDQIVMLPVDASQLID